LERHPITEQKIINHLNELLVWRDWIKLFTKPVQAVVAGNRLLKLKEHLGKIIPGAGVSYSSLHGESGIAILCNDGVSDDLLFHQSQIDIKTRKLYLIVYERNTGLRLFI